MYRIVLVATLVCSGMTAQAQQAVVVVKDIPRVTDLISWFKLCLHPTLVNHKNEIKETIQKAADAVNKTQIDIWNQDATMRMQTPPTICQSYTLQKAFKDAMPNARAIARVVERTLHKAVLGNQTPLSHTQKRLGRHEDKYCTEGDDERGRCKKSENMAGADISAALLYGRDQVTDGERIALDNFVAHVINPNLPQLVDAPLANARQNEELRAAVITTAARKAMAAYALSMVIGDVTKSGDMSPKKALSSFVDARFANEDYYKAVTKMTPGELARETAFMKLWEMKMMQRLDDQNQVLIGLLATHLATSADSIMRDTHAELLEAAANTTATGKAK